MTGPLHHPCRKDESLRATSLSEAGTGFAHPTSSPARVSTWRGGDGGRFWSGGGVGCMRRFVLVLILAFASSAAQAQQLDVTDMSLEDLMAMPVEHVYGASKFLQKVTDAPASVTIVSADEIKL